MGKSLRNEQLCTVLWPHENVFFFDSIRVLLMIRVVFFRFTSVLEVD